MNPIYFAIFAALAFGAWTVFHKLASPYINQTFGAILVSFTAIIVGAILLLPQLRSTQLVTNSKGIIFLVLAGACAFFIDFLLSTLIQKGYRLTLVGQ